MMSGPLRADPPAQSGLQPANTLTASLRARSIKSSDRAVNGIAGVVDQPEQQ